MLGRFMLLLPSFISPSYAPDVDNSQKEVYYYEEVTLHEVIMASKLCVVASETKLIRIAIYY